MARVRLKINVKGIVQGVGFRPFIYRIAESNNLHGYVRNRGDAGAEILVEGEDKAIKDFLRDLERKKPPLAQIYETTMTTLQGKKEHSQFAICKSSNEVEHSGSVVPPDIGICNECLKESRDPRDPRFEYYFITCTNCGPRFTIIEKLPYDRENTTMSDFPMCGFCLKDYNDSLNRRFHAQTVACPKCGPKAYLTTRKGEPVRHKDPIREAGKLLSEGAIVAVKGYGGFHIAASSIKDTPLIRLRKVKQRSQKPFAIMARNLNAIKTFAELSEKEAELLSSCTRPIVLLNKSGEYMLSNLLAPELHSVGVMLPYTGLHYRLFDDVSDPAFVMTSANPPNQPIVKDNEEALKTLSNTVDYFLFQNRQISHRCDDSVVLVNGGRLVFVRRSRGYAPAPVQLGTKTKRSVVGLGAELNNTSCILLENKAFISQHIGDVENIETREFLENATRHLIRLTNSKIEAIVCDLHPKFTTSKLAEHLAKESSWQLFKVQHHHAHIAGLMIEHNLDEIMGICCDGYGYGLDGEAWGGEVLLCTKCSLDFKRVAHLEKQPLAGGDLAARRPLRVAAGILKKKVNVENWLLQNAQHFPHDNVEIEILLHQLEKNVGLAETTSCGRVLDAVAAVLGICYERTYEGEPAMKLESAATKGHDMLRLKPIIKGTTLDTTELLLAIFENRQRFSGADLAYSAHAYLGKGLAALAIEKAEENGVRTVGFSGGVACNRILTAIIKKAVTTASLRFVVNWAVPPGDGGLSFGQAVAVGFSKG